MAADDGITGVNGGKCLRGHKIRLIPDEGIALWLFECSSRQRHGPKTQAGGTIDGPASRACFLTISIGLSAEYILK